MSELKDRVRTGTIRVVLCVIMFGFGMALNLHAQDKIQLTRLTGAIELDGIPNEAAWQNLEPVPLVMYEPVFRGAQSEESQIRVGYDQSYLYFAANFSLKNPDDLRLNSLYRDGYSEDDTFGMVIDPFNDNENGLWFFINPAGVRFDIAVSNDADFSSGNVMNDSWNTYWDAETNITDEGWTAEVRIPFSSVGLQVGDDGTAEIGLIVYRYISKGQERYIYPAIPPNWDLGNAKPSNAQDVILEGVEAPKPLYFTPYLLGGFESAPVLNTAGTDYEQDSELTYDAGFDLKYNISSNTTIDATFNTDFAQVEADNQQVNLTRVPLFFPEKRQFFQERASVFSFNLGGPNDLFFSRRIGLDPNGEPIRIWGGARVTSKVNDLDVGFLNMQTDDSEVLPSENFGVLRLKKTAFNANSYIGGIVTSRVSSDNYNYTVGLDGVIKVTGDEYFTFRYAQSTEKSLEESEQYSPSDNSYLRLEWTRRSNNGFYYNSAFSRSGGSFNPGIGFIQRRDFYSGSANVGYGVQYDHPKYRRWEINMAGSSIFRIADNSTESGFWGIGSNLEFVSGARIGAGVNVYYEDLLSGEMFLPGTSIPAGDFTFTNADFFYGMAPFNKLRAQFSASAGQFYDGLGAEFRVSPIWNVSPHLELSGDYNVSHLVFDDRNEEATAHIARFRIQAAANRNFSASTFAQYSNINDLVGMNFRLRYNFAEGRDLWLVYNEQLATELYPSSATLTPIPVSQARVILLKFSYSLNLRK